MKQHAHVIPGMQADLMPIRRGIPDAAKGGAGGEQVVEVEEGVQNDHPPRRALECRALEHDLLPRDGDRELPVDRDRGAADALEDRQPFVAAALLLSHRVEADAHDAREVGEARIPLHLGEDGLHPRHHVGELVELVHAAVEQPVILEEAASARDVDVLEGLVEGRESSAQGVRRLARQLRRLGVDDDDQGVVEDREGQGEGPLVANKVHIRIDHLEVVGVHAQVAGRVHAESEGQPERGDHDRSGVPACGVDPAREEPGEDLVGAGRHGFASRRRGGGGRRVDVGQE